MFRERATRKIERARFLAQVTCGLFASFAVTMAVALGEAWCSGRLQVSAPVGGALGVVAFAGFVTFVAWLFVGYQALPSLGRAGSSARPLSLPRLLVHFIFPLVFVGPYHLVRALDQAVDPNDLPPAPVPPSLTAAHPYRPSPAETTSAAWPSARVSAWWTSCCFTFFVLPFLCLAAAWNENVEAYGILVGEGPAHPAHMFRASLVLSIAFLVATVGCVLFAAIVVGQIQARMGERHARLQALED